MFAVLSVWLLSGTLLRFIPIQNSRNRITSVITVMYFAMIMASKVQAEENGLTLEHAVTLALADNPGLAQIKARADAMAAIPSQEGTLPDPTVDVNLLNLPTAYGLNPSKEDMSMLEVGVHQTLPFPGKLALRKKAAIFESEAAANTVAEAQLQLVRDVKVQWWQVMYIHQTRLIIADTEQLLKQMLEITDTKYQVGEGLQQDVLSAHLELAKLAQQKIQHAGLHRTEIARLNTLLNRPADTPILLSNDVDKQLPNIPASADFQKQGSQDRPLLEERKKAIDAAQSRLELAKKDYYPDFTIGASYAWRQDTPSGQSRSDLASIRLSMNLPLFTDSKQSKAVAQRKSELLKERYALEEAERGINNEINQALILYQSSYQQFKLFEDNILPLAQQTVLSSLDAYEVGKTDFLNVLRAKNTWFEYQMQYWQALIDAKKAWAQLQAAVGKEAL